MTDIRLHIGGTEKKDGWSILNIKPGPDVDFVANCTDLSLLADGSCSEVYASHVLEHLPYNGELQRALSEIHRVLKPGGRLRLSVPDLEVLCRLFIHPSLTSRERFELMLMMYGGHEDQHDVHHIGLTWEFLESYLDSAGFRDIRRVEEFNLFNDTSRFRFRGQLISLNIEARRAGG